jgi:DNA primase
MVKTAMMIPDHKIQEVRERVDMLGLVQRHGVELKKSGRSYRGLCPFHNEKSPSFYVWAEERRFKCFGCQAGGDGISFVQRLLGKSFVETVQDLAKELGVDLEASVDPAQKEKQQVKEATDFAARHFAQFLWDPAVGAGPREYLRSRGLTEEMLKNFGLGFAPTAWTSLADELQKHGLLAHAEKAGLVSPRQRGDGYFDMFRGRIMIPIRSPEGRAIAFGGRLFEVQDESKDPGPKYLNSKENRLYNKSETLYGVDQAKEEIRRKKSAVLCEGYFDCMGLHQAGVKNAVALCSTALTPGHLTLLHRLEAKELVLLLDGDKAGRAAVERLAGVILAAGVSSKVAALPEGEDPDTYARQFGNDAVQSLIKTAKPLTMYVLETILPDGAGATFEDKMSGIERLKPVTSLLQVGLPRSAFISSVAKHFGLPASELERALKAKPALPIKPVAKAPLEVKDPPPDRLEATWVAAIFRDLKLLKKDQNRVSDELRHVGLRSLVAALQSGTPPEDALYDASEDLKAHLTRAQEMLPKDETQLELGFFTMCRSLKLRSVDDRLNLIARETALTPGASTELTTDSRELLEERGQLLDLKKRLLAQK